MRDWKTKPPETFEDSVELGLEMLTMGGIDAAKIFGCKPPTVRREDLKNGDVRLVVVWDDGQETNECVIHRIDDQNSLSA